MSLPDALRHWFRFDTWTVRQGLLLLAGIDPHHAACLKLDADGWTTDNNPAWAALGHPPRAEWREDGTPVIHGLRLSVDELLRLGDLTKHWHARPAHAGLERAEPAFFLAWAESKQLAPPWLAAAQAAGVVPTQAPQEETPKERGLRLLDWLTEEECASGKRGALARVTQRELARRPTADRSNIGKEIQKAKTERAEANRAGPFAGLGT